MVRISIDLPEEVLDALARRAAAGATTVETLAADAILEAYGDDPALEAALAEAEAGLAAGQGIPHDQVMAEMRGWAAGLRARRGAR